MAIKYVTTAATIKSREILVCDVMYGVRWLIAAFHSLVPAHPCKQLKWPKYHRMDQSDSIRIRLSLLKIANNIHFE